MRKVLVTIVLSIVLLICSFFIYRNVEIKKGNEKVNMIKNEIVTYLKTKNGYDPNMYELNLEYHFESNFLGYNPYMIAVTYNDEPNVIYYYNYRNGEISQGGIAPMKGKEDKNFKHAESR